MCPHRPKCDRATPCTRRARSPASSVPGDRPRRSLRHRSGTRNWSMPGKDRDREDRHARSRAAFRSWLCTDGVMIFQRGESMKSPPLVRWHRGAFPAPDHGSRASSGWDTTLNPLRLIIHQCIIPSPSERVQMPPVIPVPAEEPNAVTAFPCRRSALDLTISNKMFRLQPFASVYGIYQSRTARSWTLSIRTTRWNRGTVQKSASGNCAAACGTFSRPFAFAVCPS